VPRENLKMGFLLDEYRVGWAFRYLREAKADLMNAEKAPTSSISVNLSALSMRKSQAAIYFCLGDPAYLDSMVKFKLKMGVKIRGGFMGCLVQIERIIQRATTQINVYDGARALREAKDINEIAQEVIELVTGVES